MFAHKALRLPRLVSEGMGEIDRRTTNKCENPGIGPMKLFNWIEERIPIQCDNCGCKDICYVIDDDSDVNDTTSKFWFEEVFGKRRARVCLECFSK